MVARRPISASRAERISIIVVSSYCRLGVDIRHQESIVSTVDIMTRTPDLLPNTLDLLILRTLQKDALTTSGRRQLTVEAREWSGSRMPSSAS
jgi:hypothetical protein